MLSDEIDRMPLLNPPDVTGLCSNAGIQYCEKSMINIRHCLSKIQDKQGKQKLFEIKIIHNDDSSHYLSSSTDVGLGYRTKSWLR